MENKIVVKGARENNLKNINLEIPKFKIVVFTGVSGSGKSSFAMDTLFAEGQRRYVESLSSYARQFLGVLKKPDVDLIEGLSPAIAIDQKTVSHNPRSTVGTITEIYDYLRLLFARLGHPHCPNCGLEIQKQTVDQIAESIKNIKGRVMVLAPIVKDRKGEYTKLFENLKSKGIVYARIDGKIHRLSKDISLIKTNKHTIDAVIEKISLDKEINNTTASRISQSVQTALRLGGGYVIVSKILDSSFQFPEFPEVFQDKLYSENFACPECLISLSEIEPRVFSFNSPHGACPVCEGIGNILKVDPKLVINPELSILEGGIFPWAKMLESDSYFKDKLANYASNLKFSLNVPIKNLNKESVDFLLYGSNLPENKFEGLIPNLERRYKETDSDYIRREIEKYMYKEPCVECLGTRLKKSSLAVTVDGLNIDQVAKKPLNNLLSWVSDFENSLKTVKKELIIAEPIIREIYLRTEFLNKVGLDYLSLSRGSESLAGGEAQRIRLASQIGSGLSGVLYILDEPSIGLHPRDQGRLIETLKKLRDLGNSVVVVEHDMQTMLESDYIVDFGPGAGSHGGLIIAEGTPKQLCNNPKSITGKYLSGKKKVLGTFVPNTEVVVNKNRPDDATLTLFNCKHNNLKNITVSFPLGKLIGVTGVSGSGKSSLINETLLRQLKKEFNQKIEEKPGENMGIMGQEYLDKIISIDQSPIGRTPRSNPATYTGAFDFIRDLFSSVKESKIKGFDKGFFSFNVKGGRCEACAGEGLIKIEMQFLPDVFVTCDVCHGKRYIREVLEVLYKDKNISEVLDLTVEESLSFFSNIPSIKRKFQTLFDVGLGYIKIGQSATTLSGGEAQRVKLASELSKIQTGKTLYILDEPTTGLHFSDLDKLISILKQLVYYGNTVIVIEHNLDLIKCCDHIIDLGPEGGERGGEVIYAGPLSEITKNPHSHTGKELLKYQKQFQV